MGLKYILTNKGKGTYNNGNPISEDDLFEIEKDFKEVTNISVTGDGGTPEVKTITITLSDNSTVTGTFTDNEGIQNVDWTDINNKPVTFNPSVHTHDWSDITNKPNLDNYIQWGVQVDSGQILQVSSTDVINLVSGNNVTITRNGQDITIDAATGIASYSFSIQVNGGTSTSISDGETINFTAGSNVNLSRTGNTITISSTDTNTIYSFNIGANGDYTNISDGENVNIVGTGATTVSRVGNTITINSTDTTATAVEGTINVTASLTLNSSHNQKTLLCKNTSDITITVPTGLGTDFTCNFVAVNTGSRIVNIIGGSGFTLLAPHGNKLLTDYTANIIKTTGQEEGNLQGELTP